MRHKRIRYFSTFPNRTSGAAILLLRLMLSISVFIQSSAYLLAGIETRLWSKIVIAIISMICGTAVLIGLLTSIFSGLIFLGAVFLAISLFMKSGGSSDGDISAIYVCGVALSVFLSGPGAFSLDEKLFGRREIIIPGDEVSTDAG